MATTKKPNTTKKAVKKKEEEKVDGLKKTEKRRRMTFSATDAQQKLLKHLALWKEKSLTDFITDDLIMSYLLKNKEAFDYMMKTNPAVLQDVITKV